MIYANTEQPIDEQYDGFEYPETGFRRRLRVKTPGQRFCVSLPSFANRIADDPGSVCPENGSQERAGEDHREPMGIR